VKQLIRQKTFRRPTNSAVEVGIGVDNRLVGYVGPAITLNTNSARVTLLSLEIQNFNQEFFTIII